LKSLRTGQQRGALRAGQGVRALDPARDRSKDRQYGWLSLGCCQSPYETDLTPSKAHAAVDAEYEVSVGLFDHAPRFNVCRRCRRAKEAVDHQCKR
jgi:hypothetical protein